jgi:hypothetical protein
MASPVELLLAVSLIVAVSLALVLNRRLTVFRQGAGGGGGTAPGNGPGHGNGPLPKPSRPRERVDVQVDLVGNEVKLCVDPWVVDVENGKPLEWVLRSNDPNATLRVQPKDAGKWPFPGPPPGTPVPPGAPFPAGRVQGAVGTSWEYSILVRIDGRDVDIDPEIFICF